MESVMLVSASTKSSGELNSQFLHGCTLGMETTHARKSWPEYDVRGSWRVHSHSRVATLTLTLTLPGFHLPNSASDEGQSVPQSCRVFRLWQQNSTYNLHPSKGHRNSLRRAPGLVLLSLWKLFQGRRGIYYGKSRGLPLHTRSNFQKGLWTVLICVYGKYLGAEPKLPIFWGEHLF